MSFEPIKCDVPQRRKLIRKVVAELQRYRGGRIVKGKHPLWIAVTKLEQRSRLNTKNDAIQQYKLHSPLAIIWFSLLRHSREGNAAESRNVASSLKHAMQSILDGYLVLTDRFVEAGPADGSGLAQADYYLLSQASEKAMKHCHETSIIAKKAALSQ